MKVNTKEAKAQDEQLSYSQMQEKEGVYAVIGTPNGTRLIVIRNFSNIYVLMYTPEYDDLVPANPNYWQGHSFFRLNNATVNFSISE